MIESREYPFLPVTLEVRNFHESVPAFVDTGFDGFLILPDRYLPQLGPPDFVGRWTLADGSTVEAAEFRAPCESRASKRSSKRGSPAWAPRSSWVVPSWTASP